MILSFFDDLLAEVEKVVVVQIVKPFTLLSTSLINIKNPATSRPPGYHRAVNLI